MHALYCESHSLSSLPDDCVCDIHLPGESDLLCSIPLDNFSECENRDFAVAVLPDELKEIPTLPIGENDHPVLGQSARALGTLYEHGGQTREIDRWIDLAHADGAQFRVAAPFIMGMSGGPVVNRQGEVIGVVTCGSTSEDYHYEGYFLWLGAVL